MKCEIKIRPIKIIKFNLRWRKVRLGLPPFFLSHTSFSILFETLSGLLCSRITYQQLEALQVLSNAFVGRRECAFCVGAMPAKVKKGKNKESQEEPVLVISIATRGKVKADDKQIALVVEQSLLEEEKKRALCQEDEQSLALAEALRLSLEEVPKKHDLSPVVSKTGFFDRPDNYIMVDGVKHLSSASYVLTSNPRGPSPFQPWMMTPQGLKPATLHILSPKKTKPIKPSLNWGQGLLSKLQSQSNVSLLSSVVPAELPVELPNSINIENTDGTNTEVPSVLPQSAESAGDIMERNVASTPNVLTSNRLLLKGQQNQRATRPKIKEEK